MTRIYFDLIFIPTPPAGEIPDEPIAHIACYPRPLTYPKKTKLPEGTVSLGWGCKSVGELKGLIGILKAELDDILKETENRHSEARP